MRWQLHVISMDREKTNALPKQLITSMTDIARRDAQPVDLFENAVAVRVTESSQRKIVVGVHIDVAAVRCNSARFMNGRFGDARATVRSDTAVHRMQPQQAVVFVTT